MFCLVKCSVIVRTIIVKTFFCFFLIRMCLFHPCMYFVRLWLTAECNYTFNRLSLTTIAIIYLYLFSMLFTYTLVLLVELMNFKSLNFYFRYKILKFISISLQRYIQSLLLLFFPFLSSPLCLLFCSSIKVSYYYY